VESILCNINGKTSLGRCMEINLNWTQLHSGLDSPILENNNKIDYLEQNWFIQVRNLLLDTNSQIKVRTAWLP
jgi:hypothetical protein